MSGFWKVFCVGSTIGGVSGLVPTIGVVKTSDRNNLNETEIKRMYQHGTENTKVCLGYKTKDARNPLQASDGKKYRLVFWFQDGGEGGCKSLQGPEKSKEVQEEMNSFGYWQVDLEEVDWTKVEKRTKELPNSKLKKQEYIVNSLKGKLERSLYNGVDGFSEIESTILVEMIGALSEIKVGEWVWITGNK